MRFLTFILSLCLFAFILVGCSDKKETQKEKEEPQAKQEQKIQYPITLTSMTGENILINKIDKGFTFSNTQDEAVLLNFFTTWCPPCKAEIPHLNNLQKQYEGKLKIISILVEDKNFNEVEDFIKTYKVDFIVTHGKSNFDLAKAVGDVKAIPFMILYDKNGKYATHYTGAIPEEMLNVDIAKVVD